MVETATTRVVMQDPHTRGQWFAVFANDGMVEKWRKDQTISIDDVVQSYDVFLHTNQGVDPERPSKQMLENFFGTTDTKNIVLQILQKGELRRGAQNWQKTVQLQ